MSEPATPRLSRRPALPLIWVVPVVALLVAGWMVARQFRNRGPMITVEFSSGAGLEAGKTSLEHKGVSVGVVRHITLKEDLSGVIVQVRLTEAGAAVAREGSEFWAVYPEVSMSGIRGLDTLLSGVRLNVRPGAGAPATHFKGLDSPPPIDDPAAGRFFVLRAPKLGGLVPRSPVYYRGVKVGIVETTRLADDATAAVIRIRIFTPYVDLVRTNTRFWNASGVAFKVGLTGAEVKTTTLQSLLLGGVSFGTPGTPLAPPALEGTEYELREEPEKEWLEWIPRIPITPIDSAPEQKKPETAGQAASALIPKPSG